MNAHIKALVACEEDVRTFPSRVATLTPRPDTELRRLWLAAADALDAQRAHLAATVGNRDEDLELERLEDAAFDAERDLRDHLLFEHGLTKADVLRSVL